MGAVHIFLTCCTWWPCYRFLRFFTILKYIFFLMAIFLVGRHVTIILYHCCRSSESKSNRNSLLEDTSLSSSAVSSGYSSPVGTPPPARHLGPSHPTTPLSPMGRRKIAKVGVMWDPFGYS